MTAQLHLNKQLHAKAPAVNKSAFSVNRLPLYLALLPLALLAYQNFLARAGNLPALPVSEAVVAMFVALFSLLHSSYTLGWRNTLAMFGITAVVGWSFEQAGVATGLIYGVYHYSDALGPKLGHVPYAIPVAWYSVLYPSYLMALLLTEGRLFPSRFGWGAIFRQALVGGMVMTAWDVLVDPLASGPNALSWIWTQGGEFYGVPTQNFAGWVLTVFTVIYLYRLYESRFPARPLGETTRSVLALPLAAYGLIMVDMMLRNDAPSEWPVLAAFVMGAPLLMATCQLFREPLMPVEIVAINQHQAWWPRYRAQGYYVRYAMLLTLLIGMGLHISHLLVGRERFLQVILTPNLDRGLALLIAYSAFTGWLAWRRVIHPGRWHQLLYGLIVVYFSISVPLHAQTYITGRVDQVIRFFPVGYSAVILLVMACFGFFIWRLRLHDQ